MITTTEQLTLLLHYREASMHRDYTPNFPFSWCQPEYFSGIQSCRILRHIFVVLNSTLQGTRLNTQ